LELASSYRVVHQTGAVDIRDAEEKKKDLPKSLSANYQPVAFVENDFQAIADADLIISRASSSIFEFAAFRKPVILIPYPYASLDHQAANANFFASRDAAISINEKDLSPTILYSTVSKILSSEKRKKELGANLANSVIVGGETVVREELSKFMRK
jgi:UDP-N-acetylglucosamine--N-acetylmuramyl-(pentapeptide) pyrophosphoryl-undecaprenol N-acetylglucosamine transferase